MPFCISIDAGDHLDEYISMLNGPKAIPKHLHNTLSKKEDMTNSDRQVLAGKLLKTGQKLLVQIVKEPIGSKGPRVSTDITIAGRFLCTHTNGGLHCCLKAHQQL